MMSQIKQFGFTLVEIAIVLLVVTILMGYTLSMFSMQQELKQYRTAEREMNDILEAIVGFAQTNGRLPCPALPASNGLESGGGVGNCNSYGGFVPATSLGFAAKRNADGLMIDPWGNPYRYYVTDNDFDGDGKDDFVQNGEPRQVGLVDSNGDNYIDLDGNLVVCDGASTDNYECDGANYVVGNPDTTLTPPAYYAGVPVVLLSMGKNWPDDEDWSEDELENAGASLTNTDLGFANGPSGNEYLLDTDTVFARPYGQRQDFDDLVKWLSPNILYSKMIEAGQLP